MEKNLGHATAYGYAKSKGYSGTEDEFAELMADYASVGQSAAQSAEQAAASAESASGSAATASQAAQTATSKASEAVTAADTAITKASEASQSATSASQSAESAGTSAQTATTAATTATTKASEASESAATASTAKTDAETARDAAAQSASEAAASAESIDPETLEHKIYAAFATDTATGSIASFPDGADNIPMKDVLVHIEPVQEGSGDPSPDNVRPITGWTGAKVTRTGKNLWNPKLYGGGMYNPTIGAVWNLSESATQFAQDGDTFSLITSKTWEYYTLLFDIADTSLSYYRHFTFTTDAMGGVTEVYLDKDFAVMWTKNATDTTQIIDDGFSIPTDAKYYAVVITNRRTAETTLSIKAPQIELGSTATDYEPYTGNTLSIDWESEAGTVYGGTLDVTSGVLTVDRAIIASYAGETLPSTWISDRDVYSDGATPTTGAQVCYYLASPITYTLTPQEITSLLGTNNVWADTGGSDVEYRADTKLYIARQIADVVSALS